MMRRPSHVPFVRVVLPAKIAHTKPLNRIFDDVGTGGKCLVRAKSDLGFLFLLVAVQIAVWLHFLFFLIDASASE
jgi:hypothetical protein